MFATAVLGIGALSCCWHQHVGGGLGKQRCDEKTFYALPISTAAIANALFRCLPDRDFFHRIAGRVGTCSGASDTYPLWACTLNLLERDKSSSCCASYIDVVAPYSSD
jgi:hypothetical protein